MISLRAIVCNGRAGLFGALVSVVALLCGCSSLWSPAPRPDIEVTLHAVTNAWLICDVSQRDPWPQEVRGVPGHVVLPAEMTPAVQAWKEKYTAQVDVVAKIRNTSSQEIRVFQEWNSWG